MMRLVKSAVLAIVATAALLLLSGFMVFVSWNMVAESGALQPISFVSAVGVAALGWIVRIVFVQPLRSQHNTHLPLIRVGPGQIRRPLNAPLTKGEDQEFRNLMEQILKEMPEVPKEEKH